LRIRRVNSILFLLLKSKNSVQPQTSDARTKQINCGNKYSKLRSAQYAFIWKVETLLKPLPFTVKNKVSCAAR